MGIEVWGHWLLDHGPTVARVIVFGLVLLFLGLLAAGKLEGVSRPARRTTVSFSLAIVAFSSAPVFPGRLLAQRYCDHVELESSRKVTVASSFVLPDPHSGLHVVANTEPRLPQIAEWLIADRFVLVEYPVRPPDRTNYSTGWPGDIVDAGYRRYYLAERGHPDCRTFESRRHEVPVRDFLANPATAGLCIAYRHITKPAATTELYYERKHGGSMVPPRFMTVTEIGARSTADRVPAVWHRLYSYEARHFAISWLSPLAWFETSNVQCNSTTWHSYLTMPKMLKAQADASILRVLGTFDSPVVRAFYGI